MKILTISFFDDNFGDMLIRICFDRLLRVALKNLGVGENDCAVGNMNIKEIDGEAVASADLIIFSGGAMFGFNNLGSFDAIDRVTVIAEEKHIPVVFSSIGINHMNAEEDSSSRLNEVLRRKCIRAMVVRESAGVFAPFTEGCGFETEAVCDPAVWAKYVYRKEVEKVRSEKQNGIVGLNVVRGGLFKANAKKWTLDDEEQFFKKLVALLDSKGVDYRFFTNGSILDNNTMGYIARRIGIPNEKLICPDSSREVVQTIAGFDAVIAIRLHSAILSYALDVPSVNLVWNKKIPCFYENINCPDRALELKYCTPEVVMRMVQELLDDRDYKADETYLMSLYSFLYKTLGTILGKPADNLYGFDEVSRIMSEQESGVDDDILDYRTKLSRANYCYRVLFDADMERRNQIKELKKELKELNSRLDRIQKDYEKLEQDSASAFEELRELSELPAVRLHNKLHKKK